VVKSSFRATEFGLKAYENLVTELMRLDDAWPFLRPVRRQDAPDYHEIIKNPMDFMSMRTKLYRFEYRTPAEIISDIRLMLHNCDLYNKAETPERRAGENMEVFLERRLSEISRENGCTMNGGSVPRPDLH